MTAFLVACSTRRITAIRASSAAKRWSSSAAAVPAWKSPPTSSMVERERFDWRRTAPHIVLRTSAWGPNDLLAAALQRLPTWVADPVDAFVRRKTVGDLAPYGLGLPGEGTFSAFRRDDAQPTIVDSDVIEAIKDRRIEIVAGVRSVDAHGVRLDDGTMLSPDTVIAATGFGTGLQPLVGHLDVLDDEGMPRRSGGSATAAGLHFLGYEKGVGVIGPRARRATRDLCQQLVAAR